jgi:cephalosporin-C deacetylase-like acetyl esterase
MNIRTIRTSRPKHSRALRCIVLTLEVACLVLYSSIAIGQNLDLHVSDGLGNMVDEYLESLAIPYWDDREAELASIRTPAQLRVYQKKKQMTFFDLLGGLPTKTALHARVTGTLKRDGYRIEKLYFQSRPGFYVTADLYIPAPGAGPFPAVLGVAGHNDPGKATDVYQRGWVGLVRRGFVVLAVDPPGQGERVQYYDKELGRSRVGIATAEHTLVGQQCLLTGGTLAQYIVWDDIRAIDYLLSRREVDAKRIAIAGSSGGGMQSAYMALAEPRLAAAAPSCWMNSSRTIWNTPGPQDAEQNLPRFISSGLGVSDFAISFAGKPFLFLTATRDFFPIAGAKQAFREARRMYSVLGATDHVDLFEHDDQHSWSLPRREATYAWFQHWLSASTPIRPEEDLVTESEPKLWATPTGQVASSLGGETVHSLNLKVAKQEAVNRPNLPPARLRQAILTTLRIQIPLTSTVRVSSVGTIESDQYRIEKLVLNTEKGISVPTLLLIPTTGDKHPITIYINPDGKDVDMTPSGDMLALVRAGQVVLAPDLRGWGESANPAGHGVHDGRYQTATRALLVGKTMTGMQTFDLLRCVEFAVQRSDIATQEISIVGKGHGGIVALFAAALDTRIKRVAMEGSPVSYMDMVSARFPEDLNDLVLPGVLKSFDLPDVARLVAPRPLWLAGPDSATGVLVVQLADVRREYESAIRTYAKLGATDDFKVIERPAGWTVQQTYGQWLSSGHAHIPVSTRSNN